MFVKTGGKHFKVWERMCQAGLHGKFWKVLQTALKKQFLDRKNSFK